MPEQPGQEEAACGLPDEENPEWTAERLKNAMRYPNLPPELMRIIDADKQKRGSQVAPKAGDLDPPFA